MSRLATLLIAAIDAIRAFFSRASPPDPLAPPSASPGAAPGPRPISPAVRSFILDGHTKEIQASLVEQIEQYEAAGATSFTLQYPGGYYVIRDGQVVGSGRGE
jgi:hypothetical protein